MNHADDLKNYRGSLYFGPDPRRGGALVPVLRGGCCVRCGVCGPVPAGDTLSAGWADHRLHRHVRAGVPGFSLWAPGPGRLAGGAPVWCEVCGDGLYGELILTSGHFVQKFRAAAGTDRRLFFLLGKEVRLSLQPTSGPTR